MRSLAIGTVLLVFSLVALGPLAYSQAPNATNASEVEQLRQEVQTQRQMIEELKSTVQELVKQQPSSEQSASAVSRDVALAQKQAPTAEATAESTQAQAKTKGKPYIEHKLNTNATFITRGGEITAYGNMDVSVDGVTKDTGTLKLNGSTPPVGNFGWMAEVATNISYLGVRGFQKVGDRPFNFVYQLEVGFEISAVPGPAQTNNSLKGTVNGALFNRNTYMGIANKHWGAFKFGKGYAPYYNSTSMFNPFNGMLGDYSVIMGNTGGDNRVEFGTRIEHMIWYESPTFGGGFQFNALVSPGQNRSNINDNIPDGSAECAGTNVPESTGNIPIGCVDGGFGNAVSTNLSYTKNKFYATVAYEWHQKVNRQTDISAIYGIPYPNGVPGSTSPAGGPITVFPTPLSQVLFNADVADEDAFKAAVMYTFPSNTTIGAIGERMRRSVPAILNFQNERSRWGSWLVVSQQIKKANKFSLGWAWAGSTPGDPGQHNSGTLTTPDGATFAPPNNSANMVTAAYWYSLSKSLTWYIDSAATLNHPSAHYDLGAGGRSIKTDCHDAFSTTGGAFSVPHCYTGTTLLGFSSGLKYTF